ncbi:hypothetical protein [Nocardia thailandica]
MVTQTIRTTEEKAMTDTIPQGSRVPDPVTQDASARDELQQLRRAVEDLTRAQQATEQAARQRQNRAFAAGFAGSTFGRIASTIGEKFLDINDWFGIFG